MRGGVQGVVQAELDVDAPLAFHGEGLLGVEGPEDDPAGVAEAVAPVLFFVGPVQFLVFRVRGQFFVAGDELFVFFRCVRGQVDQDRFDKALTVIPFDGGINRRVNGPPDALALVRLRGEDGEFPVYSIGKSALAQLLQHQGLQPFILDVRAVVMDDLHVLCLITGVFRRHGDLFQDVARLDDRDALAGEAEQGDQPDVGRGHADHVLGKGVRHGHRKRRTFREGQVLDIHTVLLGLDDHVGDVGDAHVLHELSGDLLVAEPDDLAVLVLREGDVGREGLDLGLGGLVNHVPRHVPERPVLVHGLGEEKIVVAGDHGAARGTGVIGQLALFLVRLELFRCLGPVDDRPARIAVEGVGLAAALHVQPLEELLELFFVHPHQGRDLLAGTQGNDVALDRGQVNLVDLVHDAFAFQHELCQRAQKLKLPVFHKMEEHVPDGILRDHLDLPGIFQRFQHLPLEFVPLRTLRLLPGLEEFVQVHEGGPVVFQDMPGRLVPALDERGVGVSGILRDVLGNQEGIMALADVADGLVREDGGLAPGVLEDADLVFKEDLVEEDLVRAVADQQLSVLIAVQLE